MLRCHWSHGCPRRATHGRCVVSSAPGVAAKRVYNRISVLCHWLVSTVFVLELWQLYSWTNDTQLLHDLYPAAKRAVGWFIGNAQQYGGLPGYLVCT